MDRFVAMLVLLGVLVTLILLILALFAMAPVMCSCLLSLIYTVYLFMAYEESGVHHAQEFENRFWTIFALLFSTALFFARDSPIAFGRQNPSMGFVGVVIASYAMHLWDRHAHRVALSRQTKLRRSLSFVHGSNANNVPAEKQLERIEECLRDIDQTLIPSTINNFINERFVLRNEREIIKIFLECDAVALNHLVNHVKLGLLIYKIKDHHNFSGQHRTQLIQLLAVDRLAALTSISRVIVLHALQMLKLRANPRAEYWVRNIILNSHGDDLSDIKTLTDAKGDYFCMNKLIYDDIKSETVRQDILNHIRKEAAVQQAHKQMMTKRALKRQHMAWRKVLSDVDDTLLSSGGVFPAGIDKKYPRKVVYPGVLAFYRELDLGTRGPEEWPEHRVGNLVFLSARPHVYKDMSEKSNFAKFEKLRKSKDGRVGMHTTPSLLAGDLASGSHFFATNNMEPLSLKKFSNFQRYVSIYPEYKHVFVCDNGQGDVRAGEMMFDAFPYEFEALYVHKVQDREKSYGYAPDRWLQKEFKPVFFRTYPEAALHAAKAEPPLIRITGLRRVCVDAVKDFNSIQAKQWTSRKQKADRRSELNQCIWNANQFLITNGLQPVELVQGEQEWPDGEWVKTPYGCGIVRGYDPDHDMYDVELDWRPLDVQVAAHLQRVKEEAVRPRPIGSKEKSASAQLETVIEIEEAMDDDLEGAERLMVDTSKIPETIRTSKFNTSSSPTVKAARATQRSRDDTSDVSATPAATSPTTPDSATARTSSAASLPLAPAPIELAKSDESLQPVRHSLDASSAASVASEGQSETTESIRDGASATEPCVQSGAQPAVDGTVDASLPIESDTVATTTAPTVPSLIDSAQKPSLGRMRPRVSIRGSCLSRYTPPKLPLLSKKSSLFSFWIAEASSKPAEDMKYKEGDKCTTPYGPAVVVTYRPKDQIVEVTMVGWKARAYVHEDQIRTASTSHGLFSSIFFRNTNALNETAPKPLEFPYAHDTVIHTPYGEATVVEPLLVPAKKGEKNKESKHSLSAVRHDILGLELTSWKIAGGKHPMLYCTVEQAEKWLNAKRGDGKTERLLNAFGSLVSTTLNLSTSILGSSQKNMKKDGGPTPAQTPRPKHTQYYKDAASVSTPYGHGIVKRFRESDGIYEIRLSRWKSAEGRLYASAYIQQSDVGHRVAEGCLEGYPVYTYMGLTGVLESVEPTTGVHLVTCKSAGMVMYLQPDAVIRPLKAAVGEDVSTAYGGGIIQAYSYRNDMYTIALNGWGAKLYAKAETFDRVANSVHDSGGAFGLNWFARFFFSSSATGKPSESTRSRSNSIASIRSHSARSVA